MDGKLALIIFCLLAARLLAGFYWRLLSHDQDKKAQALVRPSGLVAYTIGISLMK